MNRKLSGVLLLVGPLLFIFPQFCHASAEQTEKPTNFQQLIDSGQFRSRAWITPSENIVVGQQLELNIELATSRWFAQGTRIGRLEMDGAIVLKRNKFAVNSTTRERGLTWSTQLWTLTIYPQTVGEFSIPSLELNVSVAAPEGERLEGTVHTEAIPFSATLPEQLRQQGISNWLSSPQFEVSEQFDRALEGLRVGDAVRRNINLQADAVAAMMLPSLSAESQTGLAVYQKPARLEDRVNRGSYRAIRRESITYVAESAGAYVLPELEFWWWDTDTDSLQKIALPAYEVIIGKAASENSGTTLLRWSRQHPYSLLSIIALLCVAAAALRKNRWRVFWQAASKRLHDSDVAKERRQYQAILSAFSQGDKNKAVQLLQRWFTENDNKGNEPDNSRLQDYLFIHDTLEPKEQNLLADYQRLLESVFSQAEAEFSNTEFTELMSRLKKQRKLRHTNKLQSNKERSDNAHLLNPR